MVGNVDSDKAEAKILHFPVLFVCDEEIVPKENLSIGGVRCEKNQPDDNQSLHKF
jgi:hypothetical protein